MAAEAEVAVVAALVLVLASAWASVPVLVSE